MATALQRQVWIVDDSPLDLDRAARALSSSYAVRTFRDGASLLEALDPKYPPDALVVDWVMESVSGIDICRYLRTAPPPLRDIPVILLTAQHETEHIVEGLESGASDYVRKPFANQELKARVATQVRTRTLLERAETAERDLRRILAAAADAILSVDSTGRITFANDEACRLFRASREELQGRLIRDLVPDLATHHLRVAPGEPLLPMPDVKVHDRILAPSIRALDSDTAETVTVILRDVTDRRHADSRRLDFYSIIAHDLRTPLTAMLMRSELTLRGKHGVLKPELASDIQKNVAGIRSLVKMINDFLELAKLEGIGFRIERQQVDLGDVVRHTLEQFKPLMDTARLACELHVHPTPLVAGDPSRLAQVVNNLLGNAIKFTPPGGKITTAVELKDGSVEVTVTDTGPGIEPGLLPRLFERYTRSLDAQQVVGTGLGLMIVREIVEAHGGKVGVRSELGRGSTFWFRVPVHAASPSQEKDA